MKKEKIIQQEISKTIYVPVINKVFSNDYLCEQIVIDYREIEVVDLEKLSKFLAKCVKSKDLVE